MSGQVVGVGDKLHIVTRRIFEDDLRRHYMGEVVSVSDRLCAVRGYTFVFDRNQGEYRRHEDVRTRILSLGDAGHIVNKLPSEVDVHSMEYRSVDGSLVVADVSGFTLDINEFGPTR